MLGLYPPQYFHVSSNNEGNGSPVKPKYANQIQNSNPRHWPELQAHSYYPRRFHRWSRSHLWNYPMQELEKMKTKTPEQRCFREQRCERRKKQKPSVHFQERLVLVVKLPRRFQTTRRIRNSTEMGAE
jgi:hypothetical protein